jgi:hypothetical protein
VKILTIALWLVCLPVLVGADKKPAIQGAWLRTDVRWVKAPRDVNPHLEAGQAEILYFRADHSLAIIYCTVNRVPKKYEKISNGDGQGIYSGKWEMQGEEIAIEYRLVSRTVKIVGEALPGPIQYGTIKTSNTFLTFDRKRFLRTVGLDDSTAEALQGVSQTSF